MQGQVRLRCGNVQRVIRAGGLSSNPIQFQGRANPCSWNALNQVRTSTLLPIFRRCSSGCQNCDVSSLFQILLSPPVFDSDVIDLTQEVFLVATLARLLIWKRPRCSGIPCGSRSTSWDVRLNKAVEKGDEKRELETGRL